MKISYNWLCDYLPVRLPPSRLSEILTRIGLEVESLDEKGGVKGGLEGLVVGKVLEVIPHPGADKLKLTQVDTGGPSSFQIVCGAPNVAAGQKVVVAPVNTTIYPLHGDPMTLKVARIRGLESFGMICAEAEIGLGEDHSGILVLDPSAVPGTPVKDYFDLSPDQIFTIGLTPNRTAAMSHIGVAREVCAFLHHHNENPPQVHFPDTNSFRRDDEVLTIEPRIENGKACRRYAGLTLSGVKVKPSPPWVVSRLQAIGIRPVNNVVDIANFILMECGQPMHVFDADKISGGRIIVRTGMKDRKLTTLDGRERDLDPEDILICDDQGPLCLGGVMGGLESAVSNQTTRVFLESAWFDPAVIRRSSIRHGLRTDAALRFEKGADISLVPFALKRAALLIKSLAGGRISSDLLDIFPNPPSRPRVRVEIGYISSLSGRTYDPTQVVSILADLGFGVLKSDEKGLEVEVPFSSPDILSPADIAEEIMRMDGYDLIPIPSRVSFVPAKGSEDGQGDLRERAASFLVANGFYEVLTNPIVSSASHPGSGKEEPIRLINTLSAELDILRPSMLESGLEAIAYNLNRKSGPLLLFEFGKVYLRHADRYLEQEQLNLFITEERIHNWAGTGVAPDVFFLKGMLTGLCKHLGIPKLSQAESDQPGLVRAQDLIWEKNALGYFGQVNSSQLQGAGIRQEVWQGCMFWSALILVAGRPEVATRPVPRFPAVRRDLSMVLDQSVEFADIEKVVEGVRSPLLNQLELFDVFESEKLGKGKKSYAISLVFQDEEKTLTDKEIDAAMGIVTGALEARLHAEIRN